MMANAFYMNERVIVSSPRSNHAHVEGMTGRICTQRGSRAKDRPGQVRVNFGGITGRGWFFPDELSPAQESKR
jgi:hypothetical protein